MVKSVRTFNASDEVNILIEEQAPKGKGFSAWTNKMLLQGSRAQQTIVVKELENIEVELD